MKHIFILFLISCSINVFAQRIEEEEMMDREVLGYIVHQIGDTTFGKIKVSTRSKNQVRVKFRADGDKKLTAYRAKNKELLAYGWTMKQVGCQSGYGRHFKLREADQPPVPFSSKTVFMECKVDGGIEGISLFSYYVESNTQIESTYEHYYFMEAKYSENTDEIRRKKVLKEDFEMRVEMFTEDCPAIRNMIGSAYDYSNLDRIVQEYNKCSPSVPDCNGDMTENLRKKKEAKRLRKIREKELDKFKASKKENSKN